MDFPSQITHSFLFLCSFLQTGAVSVIWLPQAKINMWFRGCAHSTCGKTFNVGLSTHPRKNDFTENTHHGKAAHTVCDLAALKHGDTAAQWKSLMRLLSHDCVTGQVTLGKMSTGHRCKYMSVCLPTALAILYDVGIHSFSLFAAAVTYSPGQLHISASLISIVGHKCAQ